MGQYYKLFALTEDGNWETAGNYLDGFGGNKLMEESDLHGELSLFLQSQLSKDWKGAKIFHIGDYADMKYPKSEMVYDPMKCDKKRYVANLDKKLFVDLWKVLPNRYGWRLDPILLLTALGNGRGGGDYLYGLNKHLVGSWAGDRLSSSNEIRDYEGFDEYYPVFIENMDFDKDEPYDLKDYDKYFEYAKKSLDCLSKDDLRKVLRDRIYNELEQIILKKIKTMS